jgi:hypothetical protein
MSNSRSGSGKRQRTELVCFRMLPSEKEALRMIADREGHQTVQSWLRKILESHLEGGATGEDVGAIRSAESNVIDRRSRECVELAL